MRKIITAVAALTVLAMGAISTFGTANAQTTTLAFKGYLRGFEAMKLDFSFAFNGNQYQLTSNARTVGLAAMAVPREIATNSVGSIGNQGLVTTQFFREERKRGAANQVVGQTVTLTNPDGNVSTTTAPAQAANSLDPMSAIGHALWKATTTGRCDDRRVIFDGRVLAQATLSTLGNEQLARDGRQRIAGNTVVCRLTMTSLNGKRMDVPRVDVWMAPLQNGGLYMPLKMIWQIDGEEATFHLQSYR